MEVADAISDALQGELTSQGTHRARNAKCTAWSIDTDDAFTADAVLNGQGNQVG